MTDSRSTSTSSRQGVEILGKHATNTQAGRDRSCRLKPLVTSTANATSTMPAEVFGRFRYYCRILLLCVSWLAVVLQVSGCNDSELGALTATVIDTNTNEVTQVEFSTGDEFPLTHSETGMRTLMPAMYCKACVRWHAVPPPDKIARLPGSTTCPKCRNPLEPTKPEANNEN